MYNNYIEFQYMYKFNACIMTILKFNACIITILYEFT